MGDRRMRARVVRGGLVGLVLALPVTAAADDPVLHEPGVLFINFDGGQMQDCQGSDDPHQNCSTIMHDLVLPYPGDASERATIIQAVSADFSDFALDIVEQRPAEEVVYDMVMVGDWEPPPMPANFVGIAPSINCWNATPGETSFTRWATNTAIVLSRVVAQEAAHTWGLEHVTEGTDLMHPNGGTIEDPTFEDICHPLVAGAAACPDMRIANCPDPALHQNSWADLMMVFGPREPDMVAPLLEIVSPQEGEVIASGTSFDLVIEVSDNIPPQWFGVYIGLDVDGQGTFYDTYPGPDLTFPVDGVPDGEHVIRVDVEDQDGNVTMDEVSFRVGEPPAGDDSTGTSTGADDGGSEETGGDDGEPPPGANESSDGCSCRSTAPPWSMLAWLLLFPAVSRKRRAGSRRLPG